ncbi:MAG TPA: pentapeptide repeat-containing protein [Polyangia bacterium]|nr:pentapeptide repeat-containing protein [Polyangia bacterium]
MSHGATEVTEADLAAHEAFLAGRAGGERLDLTDANLRGVDLSGRNLAGARIDGLIADVRFEGANLEDANFRKAYLRGCTFKGALLRGAYFGRASIETCSFKDADLREADFTATTGGELDFRGADLTGAILFETVFVGVKAHGSRGFWARPDDNRLEAIDFSPSGDGSDVRDAAAWIDVVHGRPRKMRLKIRLKPGTSPFVRAEPNARTWDLPFDAVPVSPATQELVRAFADRYDEAVVDLDDKLPPELVRELDEQGRALAGRVQDEISDYAVDYEPLWGYETE